MAEIPLAENPESLAEKQKMDELQEIMNIISRFYDESGVMKFDQYDVDKATYDFAHEIGVNRDILDEERKSGKNIRQLAEMIQFGEISLDLLVDQDGDNSFRLGRFENISPETGEKVIQDGPVLHIMKNDGGEGFIVKAQLVDNDRGYQELPLGETIIGRTGTIRIEDPSRISSGQHLKITNTGDSYTVESIGRHGTYLA